MKIIPIAADSMGVRSLATLVETRDCRILIDPSAALGPSRYGLPPTEREFEALDDSKSVIHDVAQKSDILVISHYHYDHYDPDETFYCGKTVFAKSILECINKSQTKRGTDFKELVEGTCELIYCDSEEFLYGSTTIRFSPPMPHGEDNTRLGYVLMTTIDEGDLRFMHASDVQGPVSERAAEHIIKEKPQLIVLDGPPIMFLGWRFSQKNLDRSI